MLDIAGPIRHPQNALFHWNFTFLFAIDDASFEAMFRMLCLRWAQVGVKLSPQCPSCATLDVTSASMCITRLQFGTHVDRFAPNFSPTWPLGANLGSSWVQDSAT